MSVGTWRIIERISLIQSERKKRMKTNGKGDQRETLTSRNETAKHLSIGKETVYKKKNTCSAKRLWKSMGQYEVCCLTLEISSSGMAQFIEKDIKIFKRTNRINI